jgi:nucleoporin GLE1
MASPSSSQPPSSRWSSPHRSSVIEEILADDRNSEARHKQLLEAAKKEHDRVREDAERVYRQQLQKEERQRLLDKIREEEERVRREEELAAERVRLNEIKSKQIVIPPALPDPKPPTAPAVNGKTAAAVTAVPAAKGDAVPPAPGQTNGVKIQQPTEPVAQASSSLFGTKPQLGATSGTQSLFPASSAAPNKAPEPVKPSSSALGIGNLLNGAPQTNGIKTDSGASRPLAPPSADSVPDRYTEIHKNLKHLRKSMMDQSKANAAVKARMGDMRREIRKSVGQLTVSSGAPGTNKTQVWICCH